MPLELDFNGADFRSLSREEQISKCHEMAREAIRLAANGNVERSTAYTDLAASWSALASEMEAVAKVSCPARAPLGVAFASLWSAGRG